MVDLGHSFFLFYIQARVIFSFLSLIFIFYFFRFDWFVFSV